MSIFDTQTKRMQESIYAALNAAAPDTERWLAGLDVFNDALLVSTPARALELALDAAAPDQKTWVDGHAAFYARTSAKRRFTLFPSGAFSNAQQAALKQPHPERNSR